MIEKLVAFVAFLAALAIVAGVNFLLAIAGEPRAYWLVHTVLGWI